MGRGKSGTLPRPVTAVRQRIEYWRQTREKRTRMPEELWDAAVSVAREHGLWAVSRALRVNYESLKSRLGRGAAERRSGAACAAGFVELDASEFVKARDGVETVVELSGADGATRMIRRGGSEAVDVAALADAFWRRDR